MPLFNNSIYRHVKACPNILPKQLPFPFPVFEIQQQLIPLFYYTNLVLSNLQILVPSQEFSLQKWEKFKANLKKLFLKQANLKNYLLKQANWIHWSLMKDFTTFLKEFYQTWIMNLTGMSILEQTSGAWTFTLRLNRRTRLLPYKLNLRLFFLLSKIRLFRRIRLILTFKSSGPTSRYLLVMFLCRYTYYFKILILGCPHFEYEIVKL